MLPAKGSTIKVMRMRCCGIADLRISCAWLIDSAFGTGDPHYGDRRTDDKD